MKQINTTNAFTNDIARELQEIRRLAAESAVRTLHELELGWVSGGDGAIIYPQGTAP
jgi:hypothetical protein